MGRVQREEHEGHVHASEIVCGGQDEQRDIQHVMKDCFKTSCCEERCNVKNFFVKGAKRQRR